ncbi:hypothetical protein L1987_30026 [Smallanthus sonchifolius]|uniref:Uncharacterized protein n=1 Tax=Smallanthus sonchifolius TaxID=185202 RepID=A0ACB9I129_9ASTR|nr:hypothetical protein L1987_30026 [Smallanthus sonchifolius]
MGPMKSTRLMGFSSHPPRFLRKNTALESSIHAFGTKQRRALMHNAIDATNESRVPDILNSKDGFSRVLCTNHQHIPIGSTRNMGQIRPTTFYYFEQEGNMRFLLKNLLGVNA